MKFQGELNTNQLIGMLQFLSNESKTGVLHFCKGKDTVDLCFNEGRIIYATGNLKGCFIGNFLKKRGILSEDRLRHCIKTAKAEGVSIGKVLVRKGYVSMEKLGDVVHAQVEEIILNLLLWETAVFSYWDMPIDTEKIILVEINFIKLLLDASRRIDEISFIKRLIPDDSVVFRIPENDPQKQNAILDANERKILSLIDGRNDVRRIIVISDFDKYAVYKVLYSFLSSGIIERRPSEQPAKQPRLGKYSQILGSCLEGLNLD